ncbi:putative T7SS-secreted protein [Streptomyces virginiae]|uniref:putative T7SS-secreted protein n=1 Tax=Streptomyces virginiae TaxID=1961 RepID=UPI0037D8B0D1
MRNTAPPGLPGRTRQDSLTAADYESPVKAQQDPLPARPMGFTDPGADGIKMAWQKLAGARRQRGLVARCSPALPPAVPDRHRWTAGRLHSLSPSSTDAHTRSQMTRAAVIAVPRK